MKRSRMNKVSWAFIALAFQASVAEHVGDSDGTCSADKEESCSSSSSSRNRRQEPTIPCGVYMAPSTLGEDSNLGIFTAVPLSKGDVVNYPEIAIPLLWRDWGEHPQVDASLWDRYIWEGDVGHPEVFSDTDRSVTKAAFMPGVGCTVNSILDMHNIKSAHGATFDHNNLARSDPGSGAVSPYHGAQTIATESIEAGQELFASYGESWIPWIPGVRTTQNKVLNPADELLDDYFHWIQQLSQRYDGNNKENIDHLKEGLWSLLRKFPTKAKEFSVLPEEDWGKVEAAIGNKKEKNTSSITRQFIRETGQRSLEWLQEHGKCQDHIRPGDSIIPHAGKGAFAFRRLPKGTVVGYAPLIHIGPKARQLWQVQYPDDGHFQTDLIINYSFEHPNSTLTFTPYGGMVNYINHSAEKPNVKVAWPTQELVAHKPEWLNNMDLKTLINTIDKVGLSFDYIALRDIEEGEEILMDYGVEWERAWEEHVAQYQPPSDADSYQHGSSYHISVFRTAKELAKNPYPSNLHTMCISSYRKVSSTSAVVGGSKKEHYEYVPVLKKTTDRVPCTVVSREVEDVATASYTYTVEMMLLEGNSVIVSNVVANQGLFLYDKAFSQDWHLAQAFRHPIGIPDGILPNQWMSVNTATNNVER